MASSADPDRPFDAGGTGFAEGGAGGSSNEAGSGGGGAAAGDPSPVNDGGVGGSMTPTGGGGIDAAAGPGGSQPVPVSDAGAGGAPTAPVTFEKEVAAAADGYVQAAGPDTTGRWIDSTNIVFSSQPLLLAKHRPGVNQGHYWRESFVAFDLTEPHEIESAKLVLTARLSEEPSSSRLLVAAVNATWTEAALTWRTKPVAGATLARATLDSATRKLVTVDVTAYVQQQRKAGASRVAFALLQDPEVAFQNDQRIEIDAREAGATGPRLVLGLPR